MTAQREPSSPLAVVRDFITRLAKNSRLGEPIHLLPGLPVEAPGVDEEERLLSLALADALLRDLADPVASRSRPLQIAVIGPTQAGKSTVVNLLLGHNVAEVSSLAGFTAYPQGFAINLSDPDPGWLAPFFPGAACLRTREQATETECYFYQQLEAEAAEGVLPTPKAIWDTPDFDSLAARLHIRLVLEVLALADAYVLVVTPQKYSDRTVWKTLHLLAPLSRPLLVCLNKTTIEAEETILPALEQKLIGSELCNASIVTIPKYGKSALSPGPSLQSAVARLRHQLDILCKGILRGERRKTTALFLQTHWDAWTKPLLAELEAAAGWHDMLRKCRDEAIILYRRDYLDHPQRFDTFRRALLELLHLLEIPVLADTLTRVRRILTWPARQLLQGRQTMGRGKGDRAGTGSATAGSEEIVLFEVIEHLVASLARFALRQAELSVATAPFWQALDRRLAEKQKDLLDTFKAAVRTHHQAFEQEIRHAANQLFVQLQQRPALLNTLRAARVTTDAAAIALALKSGGIGFHDLLFAPALISLTSMLTESALGSYMARTSAELRERQLAAVQQNVFDDVIIPVLQELLAELQDPRLFGITAGEFALARQAMAVLQDER